MRRRDSWHQGDYRWAKGLRYWHPWRMERILKSMWHLDFVWGLKGSLDATLLTTVIPSRTTTAGNTDPKDIISASQHHSLEKNHHFIEIYKLVKDEAAGEDTNWLSGGPAHAYTELAVFDPLGGTGQVYETNEDLKKAWFRPTREFRTTIRLLADRIIQLTTVSGELFDESNPASFSARAMLV